MLVPLLFVSPQSYVIHQHFRTHLVDGQYRRMTFEDTLRSPRKISRILIKILKKVPTINYGNMSGGEITLLTVTTMFSIADRSYYLCAL